MTSPRGNIRRMLVALDASPDSLAALEAAARLAAGLEAELLGLYVEDESLLRGAELPITRAVGSFSGAVRQIERTELERHLRTQAAKARQALEAIASRARVRWSFRIARGAVAAELLAAATEADLISLGRCGWSMIETGRLGSTTETVLSRTVAPVLLLRRGLRMGQSVVAVYDGSDCARAGLLLAGQLAREEATPLVIVLLASSDQAQELEQLARKDMEALDLHRPVRYRNVIRKDPALLGNVAHVEDAGILILPTADVFEKGFKELLTQMECPVLVVR